MTTAASKQIEAARALAREIHQGQRDKGGHDYIYHVLDVAARVAHHGAEYEIVALLHDAVEDAPEHRPLTLQEIETRFGLAVRNGVDAMTKRKSPVAEDYARDYLPRLAEDPIGRLVKVADASHNLSKAHLITDREQQNRLRAKYSAALAFLGIDAGQAERPIIFVERGEFIGWQELSDEVG